MGNRTGRRCFHFGVLMEATLIAHLFSNSSVRNCGSAVIRTVNFLQNGQLNAKSTAGAIRNRLMNPNLVGRSAEAAVGTL